jgi:hypothetical protein
MAELACEKLDLAPLRHAAPSSANAFSSGGPARRARAVPAGRRASPR